MHQLSQPEPIKPKAVPLSHVGTGRPGRRGGPRQLFAWSFILGAGALVFALFVLAPQYLTPNPPPQSLNKTVPGIDDNRTGPVGSASGSPASRDETPPFAALRHQQARTEAQDELARFVELEIELRDTLRVQNWADASYQTAKDLAHEGDESFVGERYAVAIEHYRAAADALAALIKEGHSRFDEALARTLSAIEVRNPKAAESELAKARQIKPESAELRDLEVRARNLPEIVGLLRTAHNQELAGEWNDVIATYLRIRTLDPATKGVDQAIAEARVQRSAQRLQSHLSDGFAQLAGDRLDQAAASFNRALSIEPQNGAALGGLQQVEERRLINQIERMRVAAAQAAAKEDWSAAARALEAILKLDANIQFARTGLVEAHLQRDTLAALHDIVAQADALSSDRRYSAARESLARAKEIQPRGPKLADSITAVEVLLARHAVLVPVILQSDNATEVLLSNIGALGSFFELRLDLRPGAYTLIGSRDGCRDVRTTITVRTGMAPVDIRCREVLAR